MLQWAPAEADADAELSLQSKVSNSVLNQSSLIETHEMDTKS